MIDALGDFSRLYGHGRSAYDEAASEAVGMTIDAGTDEKVYPVVKIATVLDALAAEAVPTQDMLTGLHLSKAAVSSAETRVSLNQILDCYRYAAAHSRDPHFAYHAGLRLHVSAYGMYGFALLSSMNHRQTMHFAMQYHRLATPLATITFTERDGRGVWTVTPLSNSRVDARLYKFVVEMQFGIILSLHRDVMGASFTAQEFHVSYRGPADAELYPGVFGSPVRFGQSANQLRFDAHWLDGAPKLGNEITYATVVSFCDAQVKEFELRRGVVGKVRQVLMVNLMRPTSFEDVAAGLNMSARTLRRKLSEENTSFRQLVDELRRDMAIRYLRDTALTVEDIAASIGFSDAANFRHAFRRWTKAAPHQFRDLGRGEPLAGAAP
jgi:AraC-like DNA-binding protein